MSKSDDMKRTREELRAWEEITDEDREFMRQMADRIPRLSVQNNPKGRGKGGQAQLYGSYLRRLEKDEESR